jgi:hypothetical protein
LPSRVFFHFGARKRIRPSGGLQMIFAFLALCREIGREAYIVMPLDAALLSHRRQRQAGMPIRARSPRVTS